MSSPSREELQKFMRKEFGNDTLTIRDDGTVFDEAHGRNSNYVVRTKNGRWQLGKYEDDSEPAPKPKPETNDESEKFFLKHKNIYMDDTPYFGAAIKSSALPDNGTTSFGKSIENSLNKMAELYGGRSAGKISGSIKNFGFETAEQRDKFVRAVMQEGLLEAEHARRTRLIREREEQVKADAARQAEKDKIISDTKDEAYKILEAEKYPEIKDLFDRQFETAIRKQKIATVGEYEKFAKSVIGKVKSFKAEHSPAREAALETLKQWRDGKGRLSSKDRQKYHKATDIIEQADRGELTPEEAYAEMKHFLRTGKRKNLGVVVKLKVNNTRSK